MAAADPSSAGGDAERKEREVLPKDVVPKVYTLAITPDLITHFKFFGKVSISLDVKKACSFISLNAAELTLLKVSVVCPSTAIRRAKSAELKKGKAAAESVVDTSTDTTTLDIALSALIFDEAKEEVRIPFPEEISLAKGHEITLHIDYVGELNDRMKGFYRSKYKRGGMHTTHTHF